MKQQKIAQLKSRNTKQTRHMPMEIQDLANWVRHKNVAGLNRLLRE